MHSTDLTQLSASAGARSVVIEDADLIEGSAARLRTEADDGLMGLTVQAFAHAVIAGDVHRLRMRFQSLRRGLAQMSVLPGPELIQGDRRLPWKSGLTGFGNMR